VQSIFEIVFKAALGFTAGFMSLEPQHVQPEKKSKLDRGKTFKACSFALLVFSHQPAPLQAVSSNMPLLF
jgi:hypothetical protein